MRVVVLHSRYSTGDLSGENRVVAEEAAVLESAGHDVALYAPEARVEAGSLALAGDAVWARGHVARARELVRDFRPDVVHVHALFPALSPAVLRLRAPIVMTLHNARLLCLPATFLRDGKPCEDCLGKLPWRGIVHACYRDSRPASAAMATSLAVHRALRTFQRVTLFLAVSEYVRGKHLEAGLPASKLRVKQNFVHSVRRRRGAGEKFLVVGRLTHEKGIDTLLRAWGDAPLEVVGDGEERESLQRIAPPSVTFRGPVPASEVAELVARARALLIPSRSEGAPRVVLEAFAAGVPVVASRVGGLPELIEDGVDGLVVDVDDVSGWRVAASRLLDDAESIRLGEGALASWKARHSPDAGLAQLERAYADAVQLSRGT